MTNDEAKAIGLRAVACKGWREMPGMLLRHREHAHFRMRMGDAQPGGGMSASIGGPAGTWSTGPDGKPTGAPLVLADLWPDFRDPATRGCLLELVRREWGEGVSTWLEYLDDDDCDNIMGGAPPECIWRANDVSGIGPLYDIDPSETEAEALVAALEAAP